MRIFRIIGVPAVMCVAALMSAACQSKSADDSVAAEAPEEQEVAPAVTQSETADDADGLNQFFADVKIPHYTVNDLLQKKEWVYLGIMNNGLSVSSATLKFNKENNIIKASGYGFWGTESGLEGSIENNRFVVREDYGNETWINAPTDNMTLFCSKDGDFVSDWIELDTFNKIKESTPKIVYKSPDGDVLKVKYYRDLWGNMDGKAYGDVMIENLSEQFLKRMVVETSWSYDRGGVVKASDVPLEYPFEFLLTKDNEIKMSLNLWEDGDIKVNPGIWSPDKITFPADKKKGLPEYVFTRQK
ncbi:MAG: hypothetical protein K2K82_02515 [Muribaculaceae bacterium]|nr:hypothetical protein [Muribaculaceae bacterium]